MSLYWAPFHRFRIFCIHSFHTSIASSWEKRNDDIIFAFLRKWDAKKPFLHENDNSNGEKWSTILFPAYRVVFLWVWVCESNSWAIHDDKGLISWVNWITNSRRESIMSHQEECKKWKNYFAPKKCKYLGYKWNYPNTFQRFLIKIGMNLINQYQE